METIAPASQPRPGISRRAQHKRTLHARFPQGAAAAVPAAPPAKRIKLPVRRAATAPAIQPSETDSSDMSSHTTGEQLGHCVLQLDVLHLLYSWGHTLQHPTSAAEKRFVCKCDTAVCHLQQAPEMVG